MKFFFVIFCTILFETISSENVEVSIEDMENYYKNVLGHERYARHVQAVTESFIDHLIKEVVRKNYHTHSDQGLTNSQLSTIFKKTFNKMKHIRNEKIKKDRAMNLKKIKVKKQKSKMQSKTHKMKKVPKKGIRKNTVHRSSTKSKDIWKSGQSNKPRSKKKIKHTHSSKKKSQRNTPDFTSITIDI